MSNEKLKGRDYEVWIDTSFSMGAKVKSGKTRLEHCAEVAEGIARVAEGFDPDGIAVGVFGGTVQRWDNQTAEKVGQIFKEMKPNGGTPTAEAITNIMNEYKKRVDAGNAKPLSVIIFTDGEPNDRPAVKKAIVEFTKLLGKEGGEQVAISFCQVGDDASVAGFLADLDDNLEKEGAECDIVDCKTEDEMNKMTDPELLLLAGIED